MMQQDQGGTPIATEQLQAVEAEYLLTLNQVTDILTLLLLMGSIAAAFILYYIEKRDRTIKSIREAEYESVSSLSRYYQQYATSIVYIKMQKDGIADITRRQEQTHKFIDSQVEVMHALTQLQQQMRNHEADKQINRMKLKLRYHGLTKECRDAEEYLGRYGFDEIKKRTEEFRIYTESLHRDISKLADYVIIKGQTRKLGDPIVYEEVIITSEDDYKTQDYKFDSVPVQSK
jgi:hypothetical protein